THTHTHTRTHLHTFRHTHTLRHIHTHTQTYNNTQTPTYKCLQMGVNTHKHKKYVELLIGTFWMKNPLVDGIFKCEHKIKRQKPSSSRCQGNITNKFFFSVGELCG